MKKTILLFAFLLVVSFAYSQTATDVDPSFLIGNSFNRSAPAKINIIQPDGKIIVAGDFIQYNDFNSAGIIRLNADGTRDTTFNIGTGIAGIGSVVLLNNGKIMVGGSFTIVNGVARNKIVRLNTDGSVDNTFNIGTGFSAYSPLLNFAEQLDGKIIVSGIFNSYNGTTVNNLIRLNIDGSLDNTFATVGTGFDNYTSKTLIQPDGKIIVIGSFGAYNGVIKNSCARLNTNGTLDSTFITGAGFTGGIRDLKPQTDGKIVFVGQFIAFNGVTKNNALRLNADGTIDNSFTSTTGADLMGLEIQTDGKIIVYGNFNVINGSPLVRLARLNADGTVDNTLNINLSNQNAEAINSVGIQSDGKLILGGIFDHQNNAINQSLNRYSSTGGLDVSFNVNKSRFTTSNNQAKLLKQTDGKILVMGDFDTYFGILSNGIIRLNTDGTKDNSFVTGKGFAPTSVSAIAQQQDGKLVVVGSFYTYNNTTSKSIIRLNIDGSVDSSFVVGTGFDSSCFAIAIQPDGKILVGGYFDTYKNLAVKRIFRLNTDGSVDNTFSFTPSFVPLIFTIVLQPDGKILFNDIFTKSIYRLNTNGSLDTSFLVTSTSFDNNAFTIKLQTDGKILLGGLFTTFNTVAAKNVLRLNADGSRDNTFNVGSGPGSINSVSILCIEVQSDGKIFVGGIFDTFDGNNSKNLVRLLPTGGYDSTFNINLGFDSNVAAVVIQTDEKLVVGGYFNFYNTTEAKSIIRLNGNSVLSNNSFFNDKNIAVYPNPATNNVTISTTENLQSIAIYDILGKQIFTKTSNNSSETIDVSSFDNGVYFARILSENSVLSTIKIIKK